MVEPLSAVGYAAKESFDIVWDYSGWKQPIQRRLGKSETITIVNSMNFNKVLL